MLLRQMELFVQAAEAGSLSKAADQARISVAAVSQQISSLEKDIGAPLLRRTNHGTQLTEQGELFYLDAKSILSHTQQALQRARERAAGEKRIVLGGYGSDAHQILPASFLAIKEKYPDARLSVKPIDQTEIEEALLSSSIDLCFVYGQNESTIRSPLLRYIRLHDDKFYISMPAGSELAQKPQIELSDLRSKHLVILEKGFSALHDEIRAHILLHEPGIQISDCTENSVENACRLHTIDCYYMVPSLFELRDPTRTVRPFAFMPTIPIGVVCRKACSPFIEKQIIPLCGRVIEKLASKAKNADC